MFNGISSQFKIWGIAVEEIYVDGDKWWRLYINRPFYVKDKGWFIGLNEKLLKEARRNGVKKFILQVDNVEQLMDIPSTHYLKVLISRNEYQDIPSHFENSKPMRIYWFRLRPFNKN